MFYFIPALFHLTITIFKIVKDATSHLVRGVIHVCGIKVTSYAPKLNTQCEEFVQITHQTMVDLANSTNEMPLWSLSVMHSARVWSSNGWVSADEWDFFVFLQCEENSSECIISHLALSFMLRLMHGPVTRVPRCCSPLDTHSPLVLCSFYFSILCALYISSRFWSCLLFFWGWAP